jgi:glycosyltransferase involved in cell wall biosynthesis
MITGWQNYRVNKLRPLILYGAGTVGSHFLEKNKLKPAFIIDKNAKEIESINKIPLKTLEQSYKYLRETEADIIISSVKPEFITEILNSFKQLSLHPKSIIYIYHNYDLKTKTTIYSGIEVSINGAYTCNGSVFPDEINYKAKKISQVILQKHFPNIKNTKNIDEIFDVLELTLWEIKWNKNLEEQLQLVKQAYLTYINPILSKNQKLADKYQCRIKTLNDYFYYILRGNFSKTKANNKILKAGANFKISVIVSIYNNETILKRTFKSIIAQSYEHSKIEVLFVDNNSTDNSVNEIKSLINSYKGKISFKLQILKGQDTWHVRNIGVEKAKGEYVIFLDAGSQFTKNALLVLSNLAKVYKADIVQGEFPDMKRTIFPEYTSNLFWLYIHFMPMQMGSKLIRKGFIQDYNFWWEKQLDMEALEWCKNVVVPLPLTSIFKVRVAFSRIKCEISNTKTKDLYPLCNTTEQAEFYLKICRNLLCFAGSDINLNFFKYKFLQVLPLANQILDKALRIINDNGMKTKELKIEQILRDTIEYLNQCKYITRNIYYKTINLLKTNLVAIQNKYIFGEFKNVFAGKTIVLVAGGPTVADFVPIKDAIYIGVNGIAVGTSKLKNFEHIKFDFMFVSHRFTSINHKQMLSMLHKKSIVFYNQYGFFQDVFPATKLRGIDTREFIIPYGENWNLQIENNFAKRIRRFCFDIAKVSPFVYISVVFPTFHFSLFTGAKKIYLVGCDCGVKVFSPDKVYFYNPSKVVKQSINISKDTFTSSKLGWKFCKEIAKKYCPDTEIISVNPVGLKGLFHKDIYTK